MYRRFTRHAIETIRLAKEEASERGHQYVGTEHILLALIKQRNPILLKLDVLVQASEILTKEILPGPNALDANQILLHPLTKEVLPLANEERRLLQRENVDPHDILIGLFQVKECYGARVLYRCSLDIDIVRGEIYEFRQKLQKILGDLKQQLQCPDMPDELVLGYAGNFIALPRKLMPQL